MKRLLWAQLALTVAALVVAGMALTTTSSGVSGVMVSTPVIFVGLLLIAAAILGLVAVWRPNLYLWAGLVLLVPLVLAAGSSVPTSSSEDDAATQALLTTEMWQSFQETLRLLEMSTWLVFAAVIAATVSGALLLQLHRRQTP